MTQTLIQQLADFSSGTRYEGMPRDVVQECKRGVLDSI